MEADLETAIETPEEKKPFRFYIMQHFHNKDCTRYFMVTWPMYKPMTDELDELWILELTASPPIKHVYTAEQSYDLVEKGSLIEWDPKTKYSDVWWRKQKTIRSQV